MNLRSIFRFKENRFTKILKGELEVENYDKFRWNSEGYMEDSDIYFWDWVPREFSLSKDFIIENFKNLNLDSLFLYQPEFTYELAEQLIGEKLLYGNFSYIIRSCCTKFIPEEKLIYLLGRKRIETPTINEAIFKYQKLSETILKNCNYSKEILKDNIFLKQDKIFIGYTEIREDYKIISKNIRTTDMFFKESKICNTNIIANKSIIRKEGLISPILATDYNVIRTVKILSY